MHIGTAWWFETTNDSIRSNDGTCVFSSHNIDVHSYNSVTKTLQTTLVRVRRWDSSRTDLAGELLVDRQAQRLFLQTQQRGRTLFTPRNFPLGSPKPAQRRHRASTQSPGAVGHVRNALPCSVSGQGLVGRDAVRSLAHIPKWVVSGAFRSGTHRGEVTGMLHFCVLLVGTRMEVGLRTEKWKWMGHQ